MPVETPAPWAGRLARLRGELERARIDALIVIHPPNLRAAGLEAAIARGSARP